MSRTVPKDHQHTDDNTFRFTTCKKCGAGAMDQRVCSTCKKVYCRKCRPEVFKG